MDDRRRLPPKAIKLLMPVWGIGYIRRFLDYGLPTLLAPGNLPALARALPTQFVILTSSEDAAVLRDHPAFRYLATICDVEVELIDDLITGDNYSTTITLAYAQAVRATGAAMLDTCFFFLISDYLIADGSLAHVLARVQAGASGVLAGNFQVVEQEAAKTLFKRFDRGTAELALPARELMSWAVQYLHPMTAANIVNFPLCRSTHSNRLFWRVDDNTLIGRFFLMHMICIRPETTDFIIGSSCDYSFIPEMCPSGNVQVLTDSDDYLVVEMQPHGHEQNFWRLGPVDPGELAASLSEWTTARHRENARSTIVFHAGDIPSAVADGAAEANAFIEKVNRLLPPTPQPYRDHPYWIGAIAAHRQSVEQKMGQSSSIADGAGHPKAGGFRGIAQACRFAIFGRPPNVRPWHPRWPDYRALVCKVRDLLGGKRGRLLIVSPRPAFFSAWLSDVADTATLETRRLLAFGEDHYMGLVGTQDACLVVIGENELGTGQALIRRVLPLLAPDGFMYIVVLNGHGAEFYNSFDFHVAYFSSQFLDLASTLKQVDFVAANWLRWTALRVLVYLFESTLRRPIVFGAISALTAPLLLLATLVGNVTSMRPRPRPPKHGICTSVGMVFRPPAGKARLPGFEPPEDLYARAERYKVPSPRIAVVASRPEST